MIRPLAALLTVLTLGCGQFAPPPAPQTINETLVQFMAAVKANNLDRMGQLWGTERGAAVTYMKHEELYQRLAVIQKYMGHVGYRVIDGPVVQNRGNTALHTFRVELQREGCNAVVPIDLVRAGSGGWLVYDVHLESAGNPAARCPPPDGAGTRR